jgi:hypothetical protein
MNVQKLNRQGEVEMHTKKKQRRVGNVTLCHLAFDADGYWWASGAPGVDPATLPLHGPFRSEAEAEENFRVTTFGTRHVVKEGGAWDPAWDKPQ